MLAPQGDSSVAFCDVLGRYHTKIYPWKFNKQSMMETKIQFAFKGFALPHIP